MPPCEKRQLILSVRLLTLLARPSSAVCWECCRPVRMAPPASDNARSPRTAVAPRSQNDAIHQIAGKGRTLPFVRFGGNDILRATRC